MKDQTGIIMLDIRKLHPHPDNPRKNLGDISELAESIEKNGVMQNMTVIEGCYKEDGSWSDEDYTVLIGHRRLAAANKAGVIEVPCRIVFDMSRKEQVGVMLEENMHRADLTPIEQAQGFQMMLDLGETEETIAEKTGFSRTTIRRRLQIARLDRNALQEKQEDPAFQLSITDLYELEKLKQIKDRNEILRKATDSRDLRYKVELKAAEINRGENKKAYIKKLKALGIHKAPDGVVKNRYSKWYEHVASLSLEKEPGEPFRVKGFTGEEPYWYIMPQSWDRSINIYRKANKQEKQEELTDYEKNKMEHEKKRKTLLKAMKRLRDDRKKFVRGIIDGDYGKPDGAVTEAYDGLIRAAVKLNTRCYMEYIGEWLTGKKQYNQSEEQKAEVLAFREGLSDLHMFLIFVDVAASERGIMSYNGEPYKEIAAGLLAYHDAMALWGFRVDDEEIEAILDGTSGLYWGRKEKT